MIHELVLNELERIRIYMKNASDEERVYLMHRFTEDYCFWCGREELDCPCPCENED